MGGDRTVHLNQIIKQSSPSFLERPGKSSTLKSSRDRRGIKKRDLSGGFRNEIKVSKGNKKDRSRVLRTNISGMLYLPHKQGGHSSFHPPKVMYEEHGNLFISKAVEGKGSSLTFNNKLKTLRRGQRGSKTECF